MGCFGLVVVPSQWLERGPLVVLEAFAAGIPVIRSRLGGIAELVQDGVNGVLVEADSIAAWAVALNRLANEAGLLAKLRMGRRPPSSMSAVAGEMLTLYQAAILPLYL